MIYIFPFFTGILITYLVYWLVWAYHSIKVGLTHNGEGADHYFTHDIKSRNAKNLTCASSEIGHALLAKIQISLRVRAGWSESSLSAFWIAKNLMFCRKVNEEWSDCAITQAGLNLRCSHLSEGRFSHIGLKHWYAMVCNRREKTNAIVPGSTRYISRRQKTELSLFVRGSGIFIVLKLSQFLPDVHLFQHSWWFRSETQHLLQATP